MTRYFYFLVMLFVLSISNAQDSIGVIKVNKKKQFVRAAFDNIESTLVAIDKYGNPVSETIVSFKLYYQEGSGKKDTLFSNSFQLSRAMENIFDEQENMMEIKFIDIIALNSFGESETLPDLKEQCGIKTKKTRKRKKPLKEPIK